MINAYERQAFLAHNKGVEEPKHRLRNEILHWTGCRISESLELCPRRIHIETKQIQFRTLKKRKRQNGKRVEHWRLVPVPDELIEHLDLVFGIRKAQKLGTPEALGKLFFPNRIRPDKPMSRTTAWTSTKSVMDAADIIGPQATAKGLRHGFGVAMIMGGKDIYQVQSLMGLASAETTKIYTALKEAEAHKNQMETWARANSALNGDSLP